MTAGNTYLLRTETLTSHWAHSMALTDISFTFRVKACDNVGLEMLSVPGYCYDVTRVPLYTFFMLHHNS